MEKNTYKSQRQANPKNNQDDSGQPAPLKGSHKTKKKNHVSQTNGEG
ncbi:small acid-soluble spore protein P [Salipaludibacillus agaradhaerens]|jgi:small acid-soluble spore protein P (minor)|uniref:Small acid-soluble spore protein P n=1 Tax=Salipaludibacillus agaradhaerens TaxID=76935 RepID=A0A9Q4B112_SALAG|nr:small acid-soluble spore protein P [Salipaludibacillus agaradhaerens]UJW58010.1 small acid-soluble spore protein P [Bacillus sp. A116_S68]MCR6096185.1 small acid-soluble spore protein P [Salipaludibacillus agaradhaerens]MCR6106927.1 small acid-soluble spore protein P [Salipaludibacillus agaradhaerens]MCR6114256.1 small acid-soluble spore protein P [Salipaludibacillus agaradhaerens]MCR6118959.1 small acid-soluble spore protein P [Salipaludibacillus agaradhaerens]